MASKNAENVLRDILADFVGEERPSNPGRQVLHASYDDLVALAELLARDAGEEELRQLLAKRPQLLIGAFGSDRGHLERQFKKRTAAGSTLYA